MAMQTVTFELSEEQLKLIDEIATNLEADRATALREAVEMYLADYEELKGDIEEAERQLDAGETISHEEVMAKYEAWKESVKDRAAA